MQKRFMYDGGSLCAGTHKTTLFVVPRPDPILATQPLGGGGVRGLLSRSAVTSLREKLKNLHVPERVRAWYVQLNAWSSINNQFRRNWANVFFCDGPRPKTMAHVHKT